MILKDQAKQTTLRSGAPTEDGGRSLPTRMSILSIGKTKNASPSIAPRMKKDKESLSRQEAAVINKDGKFSILTKLRKSNPRDSAKNSDSTS